MLFFAPKDNALAIQRGNKSKTQAATGTQASWIVSISGM
jgi:hypothetical protein